MADEKESPGNSAKKKKCKYYYYVSSQSDEADTLKDKFWRNLEEGKIDVMQTPDLYSKVKCNKKPPGLLVGTFGNIESPVSTFDRSPSSSCGSSAKSIATPFSVSGYETGSLLSNSPLVDSPMHSPLRGAAPEFGPRLLGYDPHSAGNGAPEQNIWDDLDRNSSTGSTVVVSTWQSVDESNADNVPPSSSGLDNSLDCSRSCDVSADTDDTLICEADVVEVTFEGSNKKRNPRCKRLATKRCRNKGFLSRRKVKHRLLDLSKLKLDAARESATGSGRLLFMDEKNAQKSSILSPKQKKRSLAWSDLSKNVRSKRKQYYIYVDVGSEEADTLKDKFWRNLEQGMMDFSETGDLYSKVKGSRKTRPWASSSQINYDVEEVSMESSSICPELEASAEAIVDQPSASEPCQWLDEPRTSRVKKKILRMVTEPLPTLTLPAAYVDLTKTPLSASERQEKTEMPEAMTPSDEKYSEVKPNPQKENSEELTRSLPAEAELLSSCVLQPLSSVSLDKKLQNSLPSPGISQSTNDSKLLSTCEVAVERLHPNIVTADEEMESIGPEEEEDNSTKPHSLQPETTVVVSSVCKTSQEEHTGAAYAVAAAATNDEPQGSDDCFGNIDFDPTSPLDDLCPSSDVEFSDILELAASVSGSAGGGMADILTFSVAALESASSEDVASSKHEIRGSSASISSSSLSSESLTFTLKLYSEMKNALLDPVNIFDGSWPENFLSRWGGHLEEAFHQALVFEDQSMGVALLGVSPAKRKPFDLEKCDSDRRTLLMRAADHGQFEVASALIGRGALPNSRDGRGYTPLMISAGKDDRRMAKLLLDSGAQIDATNDRGETALIIAVGFGCAEVVELLLLRGANFSATNSSHQTAMHLAKVNHRNDIFELLNVHISRLLQRFRTAITQTLGGMAEAVCPLFPLQCFSLRDSTVFTVNFLNYGKRSSCPRSVLFIGHTLIGEHNLHCALHGPSAVLRVTLNGKDLRAFSQEGMFLMCVDCVSNGSNELVIRTIRDDKSELKLLVCAYTVQPCSSTANPTNPLCPS